MTPIQHVLVLARSAIFTKAVKKINLIAYDCKPGELEHFSEDSIAVYKKSSAKLDLVIFNVETYTDALAIQKIRCDPIAEQFMGPIIILSFFSKTSFDQYPDNAALHDESCALFDEKWGIFFFHLPFMFDELLACLESLKNKTLHLGDGLRSELIWHFNRLDRHEYRKIKTMIGKLCSITPQSRAPISTNLTKERVDKLSRLHAWLVCLKRYDMLSPNIFPEIDAYIQTSINWVKSRRPLPQPEEINRLFNLLGKIEHRII